MVRPLTYPHEVGDLDDLLELDGDVDGDVLVETRLDAALLRQRREVVHSLCIETHIETHRDTDRDTRRDTRRETQHFSGSDGKLFTRSA